ncbi:MAG: TadE/TadG family type IV pilus assembly protein [Pseudomonadota bacterium]
MMAWITRFRDDERGVVVVDFVMVFLPVVLFVFTIIEFSVAFHLTSSAQKAAQLAARLAAVSAPVHTGVPDTNILNPVNGQIGDSCFQVAGDACVPPVGSPWVCDGGAPDGACDEAGFRAIWERVQDLYPTVQSEDMIISYEYVRLGNAGDPFVPLVSVTLKQRRSYMNMLSFAGELGLRQVTASSLGEEM